MSQYRRNTLPVLPLSLLVLALAVPACSETQSPTAPPVGSWECTSTWTGGADDNPVASSAVSVSTCEGNVLALSGTVTIGGAVWTEEKRGTCYATGDRLHGTWTWATTRPTNAAAKEFEKVRLQGKGLGEGAQETGQDYSVVVTERSDQRLEALADNGRALSCKRL